MRAQLLRPRGLDRARHRAAARASSPSFRSRRARHPRRRRRRRGSSPSTRTRSSWSSTPPRSPRTTGRRRDPQTDFARQRQRHAQPARGDARSTAPTRPSSSPRPTRSTATRPNCLPLVELETRLELPEDHRYFGGIDTTMSIDRSHALAVRRLEGGRRPAGAGVRALLRHADRLLPRRLPDRPAARRRAAARLPRLPDEVHRHRRALHGLRLRRQAGARQHPHRRPRRAPSTPSTRAPRAGRGLQHRRRPRQQLLDARGDRRSASGSPAASSTGRCPTRRGSATTAGGSATSARSRRDYPDWELQLRHRATSCARSTTQNVERWAARRHEALGRHPGPQRGGLDRARPSTAIVAALERGGDRLRDHRRRRRQHRRHGRRSSRALARARPARPLPPLALPQRLRLRGARRPRRVRRATRWRS